MDASQRFGGDWTEIKLDALRAYLIAYLEALKKQRFRLTYIDAFAGTGYRETGESDTVGSDPEVAKCINAYQKGSAKIALELDPGFHEYVFIEKEASKFNELKRLKTEHPEKAARIRLLHGDCNLRLKELCEGSWMERRAVVFLDPFGMQIDWNTIITLSQTRAVDLWILFPHGIGVNRLLRKDGCIPDAWRDKLNACFGSDEWYEIFYKPSQQTELFGDPPLEKLVSPETIAQYYLDRLSGTFAGVVETPLVLKNSKGSPMFALCFACANAKGAPIAKRIAKYIIGERC